MVFIGLAYGALFFVGAFLWISFVYTICKETGQTINWNVVTVGIFLGAAVMMVWIWSRPYRM